MNAKELKKKHLTPLSELIDKEFGKLGTPKRTKFEEGYKAFLIGERIHDIRKKEGLTKEEVAKRCGTTKNYISKVEEGFENIEIPMLRNIIENGLGRKMDIIF